MKRLNLGCGGRILEGFINVDIQKMDGVDIVHDLEKFPYPFEDGSIDFILMDNVIEHLDDTVGVMKECYRILRPDGKIKLIFPYHQHPNAWVEPTHKKALTVETFMLFWEGCNKERFKNNPYGIGFRGFKYKYNLTLLGKLLKPFVRFLRHFCNILIVTVEVELTK